MLYAKVAFLISTWWDSILGSHTPQSGTLILDHIPYMHINKNTSLIILDKQWLMNNINGNYYWRLLTMKSRVVPTLSDRPNRSHICIAYTPCDYSHHLSQLSHYTSDTPTICTAIRFPGFIQPQIWLTGSRTANHNCSGVQEICHTAKPLW